MAPDAQSLSPFDNLTWTVIGAAFGSAVTGFFAWLSQRSKGNAQIEVAVLAEWQKLNGALSDRLASVEREFADYRTKTAAETAERHATHMKEIDEMRSAHTREIDEMREQYRTEMAELRRLNDGLQRKIAQDSQSTAALLSDSPVSRGKEIQ